MAAYGVELGLATTEVAWTHLHLLLLVERHFLFQAPVLDYLRAREDLG